MSTEQAEFATKTLPRAGKQAAKSIEERPRVAWALFKHPAALASGLSRIPAIAAEESVQIYVDHVAGNAVLSVEGPGFAVPGLIPWENVAALGMLP